MRSMLGFQSMRDFSGCPQAAGPPVYADNTWHREMLAAPTAWRPAMSRFVEPMLLALALVLMGCAPMPPQPSPPYTGQCDASKATWAIGKAATADVVERIRVETGSQVARVLKPGQVVTMEYSAARVNINVNERNAITGVTCG